MHMRNEKKLIFRIFLYNYNLHIIFFASQLIKNSCEILYIRPYRARSVLAVLAVYQHCANHKSIFFYLNQNHIKSHQEFNITISQLSYTIINFVILFLQLHRRIQNPVEHLSFQPLTTLSKSSILDVRISSGYTSERCKGLKRCLKLSKRRQPRIIIALTNEIISYSILVLSLCFN